ncbi:uncharacterized protein LOC111316492, partial [Durio zibethinus]|uniref:Uncharacterized protein LOC111316492 n=1 Tax=Durio zibethinus TaxID=66656 RepID=A0A6P6BAN9_DURZI
NQALPYGNAIWVRELPASRAENPHFELSHQQFSRWDTKVQRSASGLSQILPRVKKTHKAWSRKETSEGKTGDLMSHSFGEGYATRSDEEGFGGIYGGNQSKSEIQTDKEINENHPAYDKSQGSEVKEKEKARHQTHASN